MENYYVHIHNIYFFVTNQINLGQVNLNVDLILILAITREMFVILYGKETNIFLL